jgi:G:T/U-mismatch repair DNA glycosylase
MPVIQGRTREQLRQHVGYALGAIYVSSASSNGGTGTLIDNTLVIGGDDTFNGKWIRFTSGDDENAIRRVTDYTASSSTLTILPALSATSTSGDTYEMWNDEFPPARIDDFINQAIIDSTGHAYDPIENIELHGDGKQTRFDIPSNISMISKVEYRAKVSSTRIHAAAVAFDEQTTIAGTTLDGAISSTSATSVPVASASTLRADQVILVGSEQMSISSISGNTLTVARGHNSTTAATHSDGATVSVFPIVDTKDKKQGTSANKLIVAAAASAGQIVTDSITSKDISGYDTIEMWVKSTVAVSSGNLKLLLDNTAACASPLETLSIPALSADTWTFVRMSLANPETDTAIISVGLEYDADIGAATVWIDDIVVVANDTAEWSTLDRRNWKIDKASRDLILTRDGQDAIGYALIKITGGDKPALLTTDSGTTEVGDSYVIATAAALALISSSGGPATDPDARRQLSAYWAAQAERERNAFPMLVNARTIS